MDVLRRAWLAFVLLVLAVVAATGACGFDPQIADGAYACAEDRSCPNGFVCAGDDRCYRPGNGPPVVTADGGGGDTETPAVPSKLQADPITLAEGSGGATDFTFTVRLDPPSTREVTVDYATNDGTAKAGEDFAAATGKLVFPVGSTSQTVTVKVTADRFEEPDETFTLKLSNPVNATFLGGQDIIATIKNDDSPGVAIDDITFKEGDVDSVATFTVSLSGTFATDVTLSYDTVDGTAKAGSDFIAASDTITFAPGEKTKEISVTVKGDLAHEPNETFIVKLSNIVGAPTVDDEAIATIVDNDPVPTVAVADAQLAEGDSGPTNMSFTVTLSAASGEEVKVSFASGGGTASPADYSATAGIITFPAGSVTQTISVPVNGDLTDEADETFNVTLSNAVNATIAKATAVGTIVDDDAPPVIGVENVSLVEGNAGTTKAFPFVLTLSSASAKTVTVAYATAGGSATSGTDFVAASGMVTFAPGDTTKTIDVTVNGDDDKETAESFTLNLSNVQNATLAASSVEGTILNDDGAAATFAIDDPVAVTEGSSGTTTITFNVSCTGTIAGTVSVDFATASQTASSDVDFAAQTGTLQFASCPSTSQIAVTVYGDTTYEPDETFTVNLANPSSTDTAITDSQGIGTIANDDNKPTIDIASFTAAEGDVGTTPFSFEVTLSNPASTSVTVDYATSPGASDPATAGTDYISTTGTLTFAPGETSKTITVTVSGDVVYEPNESFAVTLSNNSASSTLGTSVGIGTITNDDVQPTVSINDVTLAEGNSGSKNFTFTVALSGPTYQTVSVAYATVAGSATAGTDFTAKSGTVTFTPGGSLTQTIDIAVSGDTTFEQNETFDVVLSAPVNTTIADDTGTGTITNDDQAHLLSVSDGSATEGSAISFTVSLSPGSNGNTSVTWSLVDVTTSGADHQATVTGTVSFTNGQTSKTISIGTTNDSLDELDETFEIRLSNVVGDAQILDGVGVGTIVDNDNPPSVSISGPGTVNEGDSGTKNFTFTVTLSTASGRDVTVQYATQDGSAKSSGSGRDYNAASGTITFLAGQTSKQVQIAVLGDKNRESDETFSVVLSNPDGATLGTSSATATINNDD